MKDGKTGLITSILLVCVLLLPGCGGGSGIGGSSAGWGMDQRMEDIAKWSHDCTFKAMGLDPNRYPVAKTGREWHLG